MSYNSEKSKLCANKCYRFVTTKNAKEVCVNCLMKDFESFLKERTNGIQQHNDANYVLCKTSKL